MEKFPAIGDKIIEVKLNPDCGYLEKTNSKHYSLWDLNKPNISDAIGNNWEQIK